MAVHPFYASMLKLTSRNVQRFLNARICFLMAGDEISLHQTTLPNVSTNFVVQRAGKHFGNSEFASESETKNFGLRSCSEPIILSDIEI